MAKTNKTNSSRRNSQPAPAEIGPLAMIRSVLVPLASLRLTVVLLFSAVFVTWIATLDQASIDIWELKKKHFESAQVYVPFQTFFVPAWFPNFQSVPYGFVIPSGMTIIVAMLVNLTAAHLLRFKLQAKGPRLYAGLGVGVLAGLLTWAIIFGGSDKLGVQTNATDFYQSMWTWMKVGLLGVSLGSLVGAFLLGPQKTVERMLLGVTGLSGLVLVATVYSLGEAGYIGDPAMRILWQLFLSTLGAVVALVSCVLLFRRRAGIVLLHLGIAGLLLNEIYVTMTNTEQQMLIEEGQTVSVAVDSRESELVVVDRSDSTKDRVVAIPESELRSAESSLGIISNEELPFDISVGTFFPNTELSESLAPSEEGFKGMATQIGMMSAPPVPGTDMKSRNFAGAYIELFKKGTSESLGKYLVSQLQYFNENIDQVEVDGRQYLIALRDKEIPKPYKITLKDVQRIDYPGTTKPKWFASEFKFEDTLADISSDQLIYMNNPMRYAGETFYQQSYVPAQGTFKERTIIQIVKNRGWMIPYVCCMFTVVGLTFQFGKSLLTYLKRSQESTSLPSRRRSQKSDASTAEVEKGSRASLIVASIIVGAFGLYVAKEFSAAMRPPKSDEFRLDLFGKIPVTFQGRVKPLDSLARNLTRQLCNREEVGYRTNIKKPKMGGLYSSAETKPAIEWLADTVFRADGFEKDYEILRIEDPVVQRALGLPRRKSMDYTLEELQMAQPKLSELVNPLREKEEKSFTNFERRVFEVHRKLNQLIGVQVALRGDDTRETSILNRLDRASAIAKAELPLMFPSTDSGEAWQAMSTVYDREWLKGLARKFELVKPQLLTRKLVDVDIIPDVKKDMLFEEMRMELLRRGKKKSDIDLVLKNNGGQFPKPLYDELLKIVEPKVDATIEQRRLMVDAQTFAQIKTLLGEGDIDTTPLDRPILGIYNELAAAYTAGDVDTFNTKVEEYLDVVKASEPTNFSASKNRLEHIYNSFNPFYLTMVLYLVASVLVLLSWIGWKDVFGRSAFWIIAIGLALQIIGLVMRVIISGRPPVTNLYSSFVFVSAVGVLVMLAIERFTKLGVGSFLGASGGFLALLTAWSISVQEGDTLAVLQAVLDTQFWLSTHVICISFGYAATVVAGNLGIAYVLGGVLTKKFDNRFKKRMADIIYGIVCFGLLFSFFGTVLGGLWADDSWGRFWGWDPKENGALMIVLWCALILHAKWAGMIKSRGVAVLAILGNMVTIWSWEAVNQLGIGLHAYGFTEGRMKYIAIFWLAHLVIAAVGLIPLHYWRSYQEDVPVGKNLVNS